MTDYDDDDATNLCLICGAEYEWDDDGRVCSYCRVSHADVLAMGPA